jgi:hypothetical protein
MSLALLVLTGLNLAGDPTVYGERPAKGKAITLADLLADPESYVGKTVKVEGRIDDVCPKMGCWIDIAQKDQKIRFKVQDGVIEFGTDTKGHDVIAEGIVTRIELDHDQAIGWARHLAEEKNELFDPASVKGPMTIYQLNGTGAIVR